MPPVIRLTSRRECGQLSDFSQERAHLPLTSDRMLGSPSFSVSRLGFCVLVISRQEQVPGRVAQARCWAAGLTQEHILSISVFKKN